MDELTFEGGHQRLRDGWVALKLLEPKRTGVKIDKTAEHKATEHGGFVQHDDVQNGGAFLSTGRLPSGG